MFTKKIHIKIFYLSVALAILMFPLVIKSIYSQSTDDSQSADSYFANNPRLSNKPTDSATANRNILILHSYHQGYEWTDSMHKGILENLINTDQMTIFTEYLDAQRNKSEEYLDLMETVYAHKYKSKNIFFDLIIACDDNALQFLCSNKGLFSKKKIEKDQSNKDQSNADLRSNISQTEQYHPNLPQTEQYHPNLPQTEQYQPNLPHREQYQPDQNKVPPIVFCGINNFNPANFEGLANYTGVNEEISVKETLELAIKLRPNAKKMAVITGFSVTAQRNIKIFQQEIERFEKEIGLNISRGIYIGQDVNNNNNINKAKEQASEQTSIDKKIALKAEMLNRLSQIKLEYLNNLETEELKAKLKDYDRQDIIIYLSYLLTPSGKTFTVKESVDFIRKHSKAAIFGFWDFLIPFGVIGGKVVHSYSQGQEAALIANRILNGANVSEIPIKMESPNLFVFNGAILHEFQIEHKNLPIRSTIINKVAKELISSWGNIISKNSFFGYEMFEKHKSIMLLIDPASGTIVDANQSAMNYYGYPTLIGMNISEINTLSPNEIAIEMQHAKQHKKNYFQFKHRLANGNIIDVEAYSYPIEIADTNLLFAVIHDVTAKIQAEQAVKKRDIFIIYSIAIAVTVQFCLIVYLLKNIKTRKKAEENLKKTNIDLRRFKTLIDNANFGVAASSIDGILFYSNNYFANVHGYELDEIQGKHLSILHSKEQMNHVVKLIERISTNGSFNAEEVEHCRQDGTTFPMLMTGISVKNDDGSLECFTATAIDITEHKRMEEAILRSEQEFRSIFNSTSEAIMIDDALTGKILDCNERTLEMYGYNDKREIIEGNIGDLSANINPYNEDMAQELIRKAINEGIQTFEWLAKKKNGDVFWVEVSLKKAQLIGKDRILAIVRDITKRKRAEEDREKMQAQLLHAQKMESVGRLAGGVAHDFNNMLGVIIGHSEIALEEVQNNNLACASIEEILKAANRSAELTRQLLAFARKQTVAPKVLDLNKSVEEMLKIIKRLIGEDIELLWLPEENLWNVMIDPSQIDQILVNLCVNSKDAISGVGKIIIETKNIVIDKSYSAEHSKFINSFRNEYGEEQLLSVSGEFVMLTVSDNGVGMDSHTLKNIFEPFFTTKSVNKGTGLGLATVYGIVRQNKGFINVYSEPNNGTTFKIYFPRYTEMALDEYDANDLSELVYGDETILVVEDELPLLEMAKIMLEKLGYSVVAAETADRAIEIVYEYNGNIDLMMTDVIMPEMNGRELSTRVESIYPDIRVLFMSGYTANVIAHHGVLDKGVNFIQKPFSIKELSHKIRDSLR